MSMKDYLAEARKVGYLTIPEIDEGAIEQVVIPWAEEVTESFSPIVWIVTFNDRTCSVHVSSDYISQAYPGPARTVRKQIARIVDRIVREYPDSRFTTTSKTGPNTVTRIDRLPCDVARRLAESLCQVSGRISPVNQSKIAEESAK
jgi:hypothetical protein